VLILGETGVGKELVATAIHELSDRSSGPLLKLNCATLSETMVESELFGHEAGAFTSARGAKPGLLEVARKGTVFLDEVAELPLTVQAKLLRVVETQQMTRLGGVSVIKVDVRFVAATNHDLLAEAKQRRFRDDLYYRLAGVTLRVPPLRERPEDVDVLADAFLAKAPRLSEDSHRRFSPEARERLQRHGWPGNVRELKSVVLRAALLCNGDVIRPEHLVLDDAGVCIEPMESGSHTSRYQTGTDEPSRFPFDDPEEARRLISAALEETAGNQTRAAARLGISRRSLVRLLTNLEFQRPRRQSPH
jgi:DNA-binding NtrC family response regulator